MTKKIKNWWIVGYLPTGETVYCSVEGLLKKEADHGDLVEMTEQELHSILPEKE